MAPCTETTTTAFSPSLPVRLACHRLLSSRSAGGGIPRHVCSNAVLAGGVNIPLVKAARPKAYLADGRRRGRRRNRAEASVLGVTMNGGAPGWADLPPAAPAAPAAPALVAAAPRAAGGAPTAVAAGDSSNSSSGGRGRTSSTGSTGDGNVVRPVPTTRPNIRAGKITDARRRRRPGNADAAKQTEQKQKDYLHLIKTAGVRGNWRQVAALVSEMGARGVKGNVYIYNTAIAAMARCRRPREAEALLSVMLERDSVAPDTISYNSAINAHARCGDLDGARRLLGRMTDLAEGGALVRPDQFTYNAVANAAAKRGDAAAAADVLKTMTSAGVTPNIITYNSCLSACKAKGDLRRAALLLELMRDDGIDPDQRSYSAAIATAGIRGLPEDVEGFLETMRREGLTPDKVTFNTAIKAVSSSGQCDKAFSLLAEMKKEGLRPDQISYTGVLSACGQAGEWRAALRLLKHMREAGVNPNNYNYSAAMDACGKAGRRSEALALLGHMRSAGVRPDTTCYNACINACSVAVDWTTALRLLQEMKDGVQSAADSDDDNDNDNDNDNGTADSGMAGRRGSAAVSIPGEAAAAPPPDVVSYASAITACARAKRVNEALDLLAELRVNEARAAAATVRGGLRKGGEAGGARVGLPVPNLVAYSAALFACLRAGDVLRGSELLDEMIAAGVQPNKIHCDTMVAAWSAEGEPERALALMKRLQSHGFEPSLYTYETIVWGFAQEADWASAVRFLAYVLGLGLQPSVRSWDAAIAACSQAGLWERALALLADMRKQGIRPSRVTYTAAVVGINRRRRVNWAPKLENIARLLQKGPGDEPETVREGEATATAAGAEKPTEEKGVGEVTGEDTRGCAVSGGDAGDARRPSPEELDCSIEALGDADNAGGATSLLRVMRREGFHASPRAYRSVIYACARVGLLNEAMALAKEMQSSSSSAVAVRQRQRHHEGNQGDPPPSSCKDGSGESEAKAAGALRRPLNARKQDAVSAAGSKSGLLGKDKVGEGGVGGAAVSGVRGRPSASAGSPSKNAATVGNAREDGLAGADTDPNSQSVVDEDEDGAEFDIAVVYNCIICNFARAATGDGRSTSSSSSSSSSNGGGGGSGSGSGSGICVDNICDPRTGKTPVGPAVLAVAERAAAAAAEDEEAEEGAGRTHQRGPSAPPDGGPTEEGDAAGEGLVALLLGVAERAEGSLTEEAANGGVEINHDGDDS